MTVNELLTCQSGSEDKTTIIKNRMMLSKLKTVLITVGAIGDLNTLWGKCLLTNHIAGLLLELRHIYLLLSLSTVQVAKYSVCFMVKMNRYTITADLSITHGCHGYLIVAAVFVGVYTIKNKSDIISCPVARCCPNCFTHLQHVVSCLVSQHVKQKSGQSSK